LLQAVEVMPSGCAWGRQDVGTLLLLPRQLRRLLLLLRCCC
jgi:hypothetical protein